MNIFIFDLDGVLIDTCEMHFNLLNQALEMLGHEPISLLTHKTMLNGLPTKEKLSKLGFVEGEIVKINELKQKLTHAAIEGLELNQNKKELLRWLRSLGKKIGLVTNSTSATVDRILANSDVKHLFDEIVTNSDVHNPKPDPEGYILAIERLAGDKRNVVIIEDSDNGYEAAVRSGAWCVKRVDGPEEVTIELLKGLI